MKKKFYQIAVVCILMGSVVLAGYWYGGRTQEEELPVIASTATTPYMDLDSLVSDSVCIVRAKVSSVEDTVMKEFYACKFGDPNNPEDYTDVITFPYTPIKLDVISCIKGNDKEKKLVCYQDGGKTDTYIEEASGYAYKKGMEVLMFMAPDNYSWGYQGEFPIINEKVLVLRDFCEKNQVDPAEVSAIGREEIENSLYCDIFDDAESLPAMDVDRFIALVNERMK